MSVFIPTPQKGNAKECWYCYTIALISKSSKVMLKILQARLQQCVNWEFPDLQVGFRKSGGDKNQIASIHWIIEKAREFQKNICFTDYAKAFDCVDHNKMWKILHEMWVPDHLTASWETWMQVKKQPKWTWNNRLGQNRERSTSRLSILTLLIQLICGVHHTKCQAG